MSAKRSSPRQNALSRAGRSLDGVFAHIARSAAPVLEEAAAFARKHGGSIPPPTSPPRAQVVRGEISPALLARGAKAKGLLSRRVASSRCC